MTYIVNCPIDETIKKIGDTTVLLIISELVEGPKRFCDFERKITKASTATISDRLKKLVEYGWIKRELIDSTPPYTSYSLTTEGKKLTPIVQSIIDFSESKAAKI